MVTPPAQNRLRGLLLRALAFPRGAAPPEALLLRFRNRVWKLLSPAERQQAGDGVIPLVVTAHVAAWWGAFPAEVSKKNM